MGCTPSLTRSPAYLRLDYLHSTQSLPHSVRARVILGVDYGDPVVMQSIADGWAAFWGDIVTAAFVCGGFSVLRDDGSLLYTGSLTTPVTGSHSTAAGALDYASRTLCFTGRGVPPLASTCSGEAIHRVFVGAAYEFIPRQRFMVPGADAAVDAYATFLASSASIWCDFYGFKAGVRPRYPIQFNAYAQGRNGT